MKKHILFVDEKPGILNGLQNSLRGQRKEWEIMFVDSNFEAVYEIHR